MLAVSSLRTYQRSLLFFFSFLFFAFLKLPRSTSASWYKHCKCYITMLQGRFRGRGTGKASEWEALTQGTQGKKTNKSVAPYLLWVSARFLLSELRTKTLITLKFKWGQSLEWLRILVPGTGFVNGDYSANNTTCTTYIPIYVWLWPTHIHASGVFERQVNPSLAAKRR